MAPIYGPAARPGSHRQAPRWTTRRLGLSAFLSSAAAGRHSQFRGLTPRGRAGRTRLQISLFGATPAESRQTDSAAHSGGYLRVGTHQVLITEFHWAAPLLPASPGRAGRGQDGAGFVAVQRGGAEQGTTRVAILGSYCATVPAGDDSG